VVEEVEDLEAKNVGGLGTRKGRICSIWIG